MGLFKRYFYYRRALQIMTALNVCFTILGALALGQYMQTHELTSLQLFIVGFGTLVFGIILPWFLINHFMNQVKEMRLQTEKRVAQWVGGWLDQFKSSQDDPLKDPMFWLNIGLMTLEILSEDSKHPAAKTLSEFAPVIRSELKKNASKSGHGTSKVRGKTSKAG